MPVIPTPVLIITAIIQSPSNQALANISYWLPTSPPVTSAAVDAMCTSFNGLVGPLYANVISNSAFFVGCTATYKNGSTAFEGSDLAANLAGAAGANPMSDQDAIVIRKITGMAGRQNRGRFFIGGLDQVMVNPTYADEVNPAQFVAIRALASFYGSDQTFNTVICHARHWDRKDNTLRVITECRVASRLASRDDRRRHALNVGI